MINLTKSSASAVLPWQSLLETAEKNAEIIANEVMNDAVLKKSIAVVISPYSAQSNTVALLRDEYTKADLACRDARNKASERMLGLGMSNWQHDDVKAVDGPLWASLRHSIDSAQATNKKRDQAEAVERQLLNNAIDVINNNVAIAALRHEGEFRCKGDTFCCAYIAALSVTDSLLGKSFKAKGMKLIADFLQNEAGESAQSRDADIYLQSKTALGIGRAIGIESANNLREAMTLAIKKNLTKPSQLRVSVRAPARNASSLIDLDLM